MSSFHDDLAFTRGQRERTDVETIRLMIPGCIGVEKTGEDLDRMHVDYVATLRRGAVLHIDAKTRRAGASKFWKDAGARRRHSVPPAEPDLAIEIWSVVASDSQAAVPGWTLDESSDTDLILYTFDPADSVEVFLLSFSLLRIATRRHFNEWTSTWCPRTDQETWDRRANRVLWRSRACFVPAVIVQGAMRGVERGRQQVKESTQPPPQPNVITAADIPW